jgi:hypothetical protein
MYLTSMVLLSAHILLKSDRYTRHGVGLKARSRLHNGTGGILGQSGKGMVLDILIKDTAVNKVPDLRPGAQ